MLKYYRGFEMPSEQKFVAWQRRVLEHPAVKATTSTDELYYDSYERLVVVWFCMELGLMTVGRRYAYNRKYLNPHAAARAMKAEAGQS